MMLPSPTYPLVDSCSTLFNNTLYSYTSTAFQSLPIVHGGQWSDLPMGVAVEGGVCVKTTPKNNTDAAALYIVGGTSNDSDYQGLQRFNFINGTWETIRPSVAVTQNRLYHGATYLNTSDSILVFAGTQDGSKQFSSQTFTIQASEPYTVLAYEAIAPPAISPMVMQWTESKAIYLGGSETNTQAMIFSPSTSWVDSNATLAHPIYNTSAIKSIVINGDDGSKNLYSFDMTVSPNAVNRTILIDGDGNPVQNAEPVAKRWEDDTRNEMEKRNELTVADWPAYNDTLVPMTTRTTYTIAKDQSGLVVISGGSTTDILCMFKARSNAWVNATSVLAAKAVTSAAGGLGTSPSSTVVTSAATSIAAATTSPTAASTASNKDAAFPTKILGAVLGSILAVAFILIAFLIIFRWRKNRRQYSEAGHQRRASGIPDEKNSMDFADKGLPQMVTTRQFPGHEQQTSQGSFSSMAILMGRVGHKRGDGSKGSQGSDTSSQFNKKYKTAISKPIPQPEPFQPLTLPMTEPSREEKAVSFAAKDIAAAEERDAVPRPRGSARAPRRGSTRRSSGWNRYWSDGSSLNILGLGSKRTTYEGSDRSSESEYSQRATQTSALVPPLNIGDRPELNRVMSGSPTIAHQPNQYLSGEMSAKLERSASFNSVSSYNDDRHDAFSSGIPASVHEQNTWTPVDGHWGGASNYSESIYATTLGRSTMHNSQRDTQFPAPGQPPARPTAPQDMSWLNLGNETRI